MTPVTSLEVSKRMDELGIKTKSYFWWEHITEMATASGVSKVDYWRTTDGAYREGFIPAYLSDEIAEMLKKENIQYQFCRGFWEAHWYQTRRGIGAGVQPDPHREKATTLVDVCASMAIYLKEQGIIWTKNTFSLKKKMKTV